MYGLNLSLIILFSSKLGFDSNIVDFSLPVILGILLYF